MQPCFINGIRASEETAKNKMTKPAEDYLKFASKLQNVHGLKLIEKAGPVQGN